MTYILSNYCKLLEIRIDYLFRPRNDYHILLKKKVSSQKLAHN